MSSERFDNHSNEEPAYSAQPLQAFALLTILTVSMVNIADKEYGLFGSHYAQAWTIINLFAIGAAALALILAYRGSFAPYYKTKVVFLSLLMIVAGTSFVWGIQELVDYVAHGVK